MVVKEPEAVRGDVIWGMFYDKSPSRRFVERPGLIKFRLASYLHHHCGFSVGTACNFEVKDS